MSRIVVTGRVPEPPSSAAPRRTWVSPHGRALDQPRGAPAPRRRRRRHPEPAHDRVDGELLDAAGPQLKVVANVAVGYDNIDVAACRERGVVATNTPGVLTDATADIALA